MKDRILPAREIVSSWCRNRRSKSLVERLARTIDVTNFTLLLTLFPRDRYSTSRYELLESLALFNGDNVSPLLRSLFLEDERNDNEALEQLAVISESPFVAALLYDRCATVAHRKANDELREHYESLIGTDISKPLQRFFEFRALERKFDAKLRSGRIEDGRILLAELTRLLPEVIGFDALECHEAAAKFRLMEAEDDPECIWGYLDLREDTRLFDHERALIALRAADVLSTRHQYASALALRLDILDSEDSALPHYFRGHVTLSLAADLIVGGAPEIALARLSVEQPSFRANELVSNHDARRLEALALLGLGQLKEAETILANTPPADRVDTFGASLEALVKVRLLRAAGDEIGALELADEFVSNQRQELLNDRWFALLARDRTRLLHSQFPQDASIIHAADIAIHSAARVRDTASLRDVYFTLAMHYATSPKTAENAIEACRDAERAARSILETIAADRDVLFRLLPPDFKGEAVVSSLLGNLAENARRGLSNLFVLIRSLVRQSRSTQSILASLRDSQRQVTRILETLPLVFWTSFGKARSFELSRAQGDVERVMGRHQEELTKFPGAWLESIHQDDRAIVRQCFERVEANLGGETCEFRIRHPDGSERWVEVQVRPVIGENHDDGVLYGLMADVTGRHALQEEMARSQRMKSLSRVMDNVAHEFNNIIGAILSASTFLQETLDENDASQELIHAIEDSAIRGRDLTAKLASFADESLDKLTIIELNKIVSETIDIARILITVDTQIEFEGSQIDLPVMISRSAFTQALLELIRNAEEASQKGSIIRVRTEMNDCHAILEVIDEGHGMNARDIDRAFDPFFTTKDGTGRRGLGLTTCYKAVENAGGDVAIHSRLQEGTRISIRLPLTQQEAKESTRGLGRVQDLSIEGRLLVVDDDPVFLKVSRSILENAGFEVAAATNGVEGYELFDSAPESWSMIVTDVRMPRVDGIGLIERIRQRRPALPILLMTGYAEGSLPIADEFGANVRVIRKPFTAGGFLEEAAQLLAGDK